MLLENVKAQGVPRGAEVLEPSFPFLSAFQAEESSQAVANEKNVLRGAAALLSLHGKRL